MKIVVLGLSSDDVSEDLRQLQLLFGDALDAVVAKAAFDTPIQSLVFTPIITRPGIGPFGDKISYLRREPAINAAINIEHQAWVRGDKHDRVDLVAAALIKVIQLIKETKLDVRAKSQLNGAIEEARHAVLRQIPH